MLNLRDVQRYTLNDLDFRENQGYLVVSLQRVFEFDLENNASTTVGKLFISKVITSSSNQISDNFIHKFYRILLKFNIKYLLS
jgi:hypothetical protein